MNAPAIPTTPLPIARRMDDIESFHAMEIAREAYELARQGSSIIAINVGEPDFAAPAAVMDAADAAIRRGDTHYTVRIGNPIGFRGVWLTADAGCSHRSSILSRHASRYRPNCTPSTA